MLIQLVAFCGRSLSGRSVQMVAYKLANHSMQSNNLQDVDCAINRETT
jgi:hypothetical protein